MQPKISQIMTNIIIKANIILKFTAKSAEVYPLLIKLFGRFEL
jgi:hypothetical protein